MPLPLDKVIAVVRQDGPARGGEPALGGLASGARYIPIEGEPASDPTVRALWILWVPSARQIDLGWADAAYLVDERAQWGQGERGGITRFSFLHAAAGVGRQAFGDHWRDVHAPLARRHHPNLWRYVQNVVVDLLTPETPDVDGIAELSFRSLTDLVRRRYDSEEGRQIIGDDVSTFIDVAAGWRLLTAEDVVADSNTF